MLRLSALVWLVGLVAGKTKYCCMAPQYESDTYILDARLINNTTVTITTGDGMVSVDSRARMIASSTNLNSGGIPMSVRVIQIYNNSTQYTIQGNVCRKSHLPTWTPKCVPDDAKLLTTTYYGLPPNNTVDVDIYELVIGANTVFATVARPDCTVYNEAVYGSHAGTSAMSVKTFGNFTLGIRDRSVFDIPAICDAGVHEPAAPVPLSGFF